MQSHAKILIVDNEPFNVDYLEQVLADLGYATFSATSGPEALVQAATDPPDLVLLDIMMPAMNGFQVLEQLKAHPTWRNIPVIIISALSDMSSVVKGLMLGAEDYLPKPFNLTLLRARLSSSLEKKRLHDQEALYLRSLAQVAETGRQSQTAFLPALLPQPPGWTLTARLLPGPTAAGAFYDAFPVAGGERIGLVIGTVNDQGGAAALFMPLFRSLLRMIASQDDLLPTATRTTQALDETATLITTVQLTNEYIARTHCAANLFAPLFFALLDPHTGALRYLNAGHEPPLILDPTGVKARLQATGPVVGRWSGSVFQVATAHLEPGDTLFAFTTSSTNAFPANREPLRLAQWLQGVGQGISKSRALLDHIETSLRTQRAGGALEAEFILFGVGRD